MFKFLGKAVTFLKARKYTPGRSGKQVRLIVIHTAENQELPGQAKVLAGMFNRPTSPDASAHFMLDNKEAVESVDLKDTAWATGVQEINQVSISLELSGLASQSVLGWKDPYSVAELQLAANLVAELCKDFKIPAIKLGYTGVKTGKGIIGHNDVTKAYSVYGGHTDPGLNFPWVDFIKLVNVALNKLNGK